MIIISPNNLINRNKQKKQRKGRGISSNRGNKCGRGDKGQKARSSIKTEGGAFRSYLKMRKIGFVNTRKKQSVSVSTKTLSFMFDKLQATSLSRTDILSYIKQNKNKKLKIIGGTDKETDQSIMRKIVKDDKVLSSKQLQI